MNHPIPRYSFLAFQFNMLLDQGRSVPINEVQDRIRDGSLLEWADHEFASVDLGLYQEAERQSILSAFSGLADTVNEGRKFGVSQNGFALLVAYCIEIIQTHTTTSTAGALLSAVLDRSRRYSYADGGQSARQLSVTRLRRLRSRLLTS